MERTVLTPQRRSEIKKLNIGRIIIFCEGKTEKYYFDYFSDIIKKNKYTEIDVILETANGNAQTVLNYANSFMAEEDNNRKYSTFGKYLVFDCDDPPDIQSVISSAKDYELLISNYLFETWLLMHFEEVDCMLSKRKTYKRLSDHLCSAYTKGNRGKTREIIQNGNVEKAIENAQALDQQYATQGKSIFANIGEMNPYTSVHKLIEQFLLEIS
jgi:hypothetical protein